MEFLSWDNLLGNRRRWSLDMWFSLPATSFQTEGRYNWIHFYFNYNSLALKKSPMEICKPPQMPPFQIPWILMWPGFPSAGLRLPTTTDVCCCYGPKVSPNKDELIPSLSLLSSFPPSFYFSFWRERASKFCQPLPLQKIGERKPFVMNDSRVQTHRASFCSPPASQRGSPTSLDLRFRSCHKSWDMLDIWRAGSL